MFSQTQNTKTKNIFRTKNTKKNNNKKTKTTLNITIRKKHLTALQKQQKQKTTILEYI